MKAKEQSVTGLTKGVEFLLKKNGVEYLKGTGSFQDEHTVKVALNDGGETTVVAKNIIIATGSEATPFPGLEIDEKRVITSTGAIALEKVPGKMLVIGGGIIGLEMASVWSRLGSEVTVIEFLDQIGGPGMDTEIAKQAQKILKKQGINFKTGTKVVSGDKSGDLVKLEVDSAKGGKPETVSSPCDCTDPASPSRLLVLSSRIEADRLDSLMPTLSWLPLDVAHTPVASASRTLALSSMTVAVLSSTRSIVPSSPTFAASETPLSAPCLRTRQRRRVSRQSSSSRRVMATSTMAAFPRSCTHTPRSPGSASPSRT